MRTEILIKVLEPILTNWIFKEEAMIDLGRVSLETKGGGDWQCIDNMAYPFTYYDIPGGQCH